MITNSGSKKALSRERILEAASKGLRRAGFNGIGVADVMKEAGLTHGGFYSHFESRDALLAEAMVYASKQVAVAISSNVHADARHGVSRFKAFVETYLSEGQIADCQNGCPVAALCGDTPYQGPAVVESSHTIIANLLGLVQSVLPRDAAPSVAWAVTSAMVGAMQLARALGDNSSGRAVLAAARAELIAHYDDQH